MKSCFILITYCLILLSQSTKVQGPSYTIESSTPNLCTADNPEVLVAIDSSCESSTCLHVFWISKVLVGFPSDTTITREEHRNHLITIVDTQGQGCPVIVDNGKVLYKEATGTYPHYSQHNSTARLVDKKPRP